LEHYLQIVPFSFAALLAFKQRVSLRKQAAALKIQKSVRCYFALKSYSELRCSAITLQTGLRAFGAYREYVLKKQEKASINIQVDYSLSVLLKGNICNISCKHFYTSSLRWMIS
jgi:hypothetical protein